jgi:hypothetical protein
VGLLYNVGLLSFPQTISLFLLNDKKEEEGRTMGKVSGKEEMEERRRNKKKFGVLGCRIILWVFFPLSEVVACDRGQKTPLRIERREVIPIYNSVGAKKPPFVAHHSQHDTSA